MDFRLELPVDAEQKMGAMKTPTNRGGRSSLADNGRPINQSPAGEGAPMEIVGWIGAAAAVATAVATTLTVLYLRRDHLSKQPEIVLVARTSEGPLRLYDLCVHPGALPCHFVRLEANRPALIKALQWRGSAGEMVDKPDHGLPSSSIDVDVSLPSFRASPDGVWLTFFVDSSVCKSLTISLVSSRNSLLLRDHVKAKIAIKP
jgi:hypothetical protein